MNEPSQEILRKEFAYNEKDGGLFRINRQADQAVLLHGKPQERNSDGRIVHGVCGERWLESRLVWIWHNGPIGEGNDVRHRGGSHINTIGNLYLAPKSGTVKATESRAKVESICSRCNRNGSPDEKESVAKEFESGDFGNDEANRIARMLAQEIREDTANGSYITREAIMEGVIAIKSAAGCY